MIQGPVELGQFPKPQVVLPGDLIEILIAHDMVALGRAHHGDGVDIHRRPLGQAVREGPGGQGGAQAHSQNNKEKHKCSCDYCHLVYFI
jgi:hypothetical protein